MSVTNVHKRLRRIHTCAEIMQYNFDIFSKMTRNKI